MSLKITDYPEPPDMERRANTRRIIERTETCTACGGTGVGEQVGDDCDICGGNGYVCITRTRRSRSKGAGHGGIEPQRR